MLLLLMVMIEIKKMMIKSGLPLGKGGLNPSQAQKCLLSKEGRVNCACLWLQTQKPRWAISAVYISRDRLLHLHHWFTFLLEKGKKRGRLFLPCMPVDYENYPHIFP